jgi:hypothetical protein
MKLCVANLPADTTAADLTTLVAPFGAAETVDVWGSLGAAGATRVGYVVLPAGGPAAIAGLNGALYRGRHLLVSQVWPWDGSGPAGGPWPPEASVG